MNPQILPQPAPSAPLASAPTPPAIPPVNIDPNDGNIWQYLSTTKRRQLLVFTLVAFLWELLLVIISLILFHSKSSGYTSEILYTLGIGTGALITVGLVLYATFSKAFEEQLLANFAASNGYAYQKDGTVDETYGTLFTFHGSRAVSDVITGQYEGAPLRLFVYELTVPTGRSEYVYTNTVLELDVGGQLPPMLLAAHGYQVGRLDIADGFAEKHTITLEGNFNEHFRLYAPESLSVEALEVFNPETMALMEDGSKRFNVEFCGGRIYIYLTSRVNSTGELRSAFNLAKQLVNQVKPLAASFQTSAAIATSNQAISIAQTKRQNRPLTPMTVVWIAIVMAGVVIIFLISSH